MSAHNNRGPFDDTLARMVLSSSGLRIRSVSPVTGLHPGDHGDTFYGYFDDTPAYIKVFDDPLLCQVEQRCLERCRDACLPVPETLATVLSRDPHARSVLIMKPATGHRMTSSSLCEGHIHDMGRLLRSIHSIKVKGFGRLEPRGNSIAGSSASFKESLNAAWHSMQYLIEHSLLSMGERITAVRALDDISTLTLIEGSLLHGDYQLPHLFAMGLNITGIIDFGNATAGDPRRDIANSLYYLPTHYRSMFLSGYGISDDAEILARYLVTVAVQKLHYRIAYGHNERVHSALTKMRYYLSQLT